MLGRGMAVLWAAVVWTAVLSVGTMAAQTKPAPAPANAGGTINGSIRGSINGSINGTIDGRVDSRVSGSAPQATEARTRPAAGPDLGPQTAPMEVPGLQTKGSSGYRLVSPLVQPTLSPGVVELMELEGRFSEAVGAGGGKTFVEWFADDAVVLNNGKPAMLGRGAIAAEAQWNPKQYRLTWVAQGAQMGPSNDMGFTWGHYEGHSTDANGQPVVTSGRYMTVWKKTKAGWKVAMDASSNEPAAAGECCALPKP